MTPRHPSTFRALRWSVAIAIAPFVGMLWTVAGLADVLARVTLGMSEDSLTALRKLIDVRS